ncbi:MAG: helix-turn-helix transcriptional regulator [Ruminococcaceae bacterium]|nr:helix-turn-helix transcriptional regulator [Oscillospiraceae bacterium]
MGGGIVKLKELREDRDITQKELADVLNITQNTYSNYENGKTEPPYEIMKKLCLFYGVSADYILGLPKGLKYPER